MTPRPVRHLTPRYIINRVRDRWYRLTHPDDPWLTPWSIQFLSRWLKPTDRGLEFGSGRSTLWLAQRVAALTSVEHSSVWHQRICYALQEQGLGQVDYRLAENKYSPSPPQYVAIVDEFPDNSLDFVLVDGILRDACVNASIDKIKPGGILIIDDAHRYLPSDSIAPYARSLADGPAGAGWTTFLEKVQAWRYLWTSKGVSDTVIYFKP